MVKNIYINLPVKDLQKTMAFFTGLGFSFNLQFTDETAACLVLGEHIYAMVMTEEKFLTFTKKEVANAHKTTEVLIAIDAESREKVDEMVQMAVELGGSIYREPDDYGWMYSRSFADLDGHQWEVLWIDEANIPAKP